MKWLDNKTYIYFLKFVMKPFRLHKKQTRQTKHVRNLYLFYSCASVTAQYVSYSVNLVIKTKIVVRQKYCFEIKIRLIEPWHRSD